MEAGRKSSDLSIRPESVMAALNALQGRNLCDRCLGRLFAKDFRGTEHGEIGAKIRSLSGLSPVPGTDCFLCRGLFDRIDELSNLPMQELHEWDFDTLWVGSRLEFGTRKREEEILSGSAFPAAESLKVEVNREIGKRLSQLTGKEGRMTNPDMLVIIDTAFMTYSLEPAPLFVYGRYRKFVRGIPQTKWPCRKCHGKGCTYCGYKGKMYETSVEELISPILMAESGASEHFFHGMGREDIDAVMLGNGRPFIMELTGPRRRHLDLRMVGERINGSNEGKIAVSDLRNSDREEVRLLKAAAPLKTYLITFRTVGKINKQLLSEVISKLSGAKLSQRTPQRVAHRRADMIRERTVHSCALVRVEGDTVTLEIEAESGTYIKEFVTGDGGRTVPSISDALGVACEVVSLDVSEVSTGAGEKW